MTAPDPLTLLRTQSLASLVQERIERMILTGQLMPGEPLREMALAAALGVSRGPVRDAFRGLEEKGLIETRKNRGVYVRTLSHAVADQIYEVRVVLEGLIGRRLAETITPEGLRHLAGILEEMASAAEDADVNPYTSLNLTYHDALARLTGNAKLHETYSRLVAQLTLFRRRAYLHDAQSMALSLREHRAIYDAVAARDPDRAAALLGAHAEDSRSRLHASLLPTDTALSDRGTMSGKV